MEFNLKVESDLKVRVRAGSRAVLECGAEGDEPIRFRWRIIIHIIVVIVVIITNPIVTIAILTMQYLIWADQVPLEEESNSAWETGEFEAGGEHLTDGDDDEHVDDYGDDYKMDDDETSDCEMKTGAIV